MNNFCGVVSLSDEPLDQSLIHSMAAALNYRGTDAIHFETNQTVAVANLTVHPHSPCHENLPSKSSNIIFAGDVRLDNRPELASILGLGSAEADRSYVIAAFEKWGTQCCQYLLGDFAFALWDRRTRTLLCARDQIGILPLYFYSSHRFFAFSSEIKALFCVPGAARQISLVALQESFVPNVLGTLKNSENTLYENIFELPPAHSRSVTRGSQTAQRYWDLDPGCIAKPLTLDDYASELRHKIQEAVRCRLPSTGSVGCELSGGLDSSAVTAFAARERKDIYTFTNVPLGTSTTFTNEREFAERLCDFVDISQRRFIDGSSFDVEHELEHTLSIIDQPSSAIWIAFRAPIVAAAEAAHCRVLLSGFGGDECISHIGTSYRDQLAANRDWSGLFGLLCEEHRTFGAMRPLIGQMLRHYLPDSMRWFDDLRDPYGSISVREQKKWKLDLPVNLKHKARSYNHTNRHFKELGLKRSMYHRLTGDRSRYVRDMVSGLSQLGRTTRFLFPLLDIRILTFALSAPIHYRADRRTDRLLMREALRGIIPEELRTRRDKAGSIYPGPIEQFFKFYQEQSGDSAIGARRSGRQEFLARTRARAFLLNLACQIAFKMDEKAARV